MQQSFKPFFVHINPNNPGKLFGQCIRAATLFVSPIEGDDRNVSVGIARCCKKDEFCKATGRTIAQASEKQVVNKRDIPTMCGQLEYDCYGYESQLPEYMKNRYNYLLRNFL